MDLCKAQTEMKEYDIGSSKPTIHWWLARKKNVYAFMVGLVVMNLRSNLLFSLSFSMITIEHVICCIEQFNLNFTDTVIIYNKRLLSTIISCWQLEHTYTVNSVMCVCYWKYINREYKQEK